VPGELARHGLVNAGPDQVPGARAPEVVGEPFGLDAAVRQPPGEPGFQAGLAPGRSRVSLRLPQTAGTRRVGRRPLPALQSEVEVSAPYGLWSPRDPPRCHCARCHRAARGLWGRWGREQWSQRSVRVWQPLTDDDARRAVLRVRRCRSVLPAARVLRRRTHTLPDADADAGRADDHLPADRREHDHHVSGTVRCGWFGAQGTAGWHVPRGLSTSLAPHAVFTLAVSRVQFHSSHFVMTSEPFDGGACTRDDMAAGCFEAPSYVPPIQPIVFAAFNAVINGVHVLLSGSGSYADATSPTFEQLELCGQPEGEAGMCESIRSGSVTGYSVTLFAAPVT